MNKEMNEVEIDDVTKPVRDRISMFEHPVLLLTPKSPPSIVLRKKKATELDENDDSSISFKHALAAFQGEKDETKGRSNHSKNGSESPQTQQQSQALVPKELSQIETSSLMKPSAIKPVRNDANTNAKEMFRSSRQKPASVGPRQTTSTSLAPKLSSTLKPKEGSINVSSSSKLPPLLLPRPNQSNEFATKTSELARPKPSNFPQAINVSNNSSPFKACIRMSDHPSSISSITAIYSNDNSDTSSISSENRIGQKYPTGPAGQTVTPPAPPSRRLVNNCNSSSASSSTPTAKLPPRPTNASAFTHNAIQSLLPALPPRQNAPIIKANSLPPPVKKTVEVRRQQQLLEKNAAQMSKAHVRFDLLSAPEIPPRRVMHSTKQVQPDTPTQAQIRRYSELFDPYEKNGVIDAAVIRSIWIKSKLDSTTLYRIYSLVDRNRKSALSKDEFIIGTWLIDQRLAGRQVPTNLGILL